MDYHFFLTVMCNTRYRHLDKDISICPKQGGSIRILTANMTYFDINTICHTVYMNSGKAVGRRTWRQWCTRWQPGTPAPCPTASRISPPDTEHHPCHNMLTTPGVLVHCWQLYILSFQWNGLESWQYLILKYFSYLRHLYIP